MARFTGSAQRARSEQFSRVRVRRVDLPLAGAVRRAATTRSEQARRRQRPQSVGDRADRRPDAEKASRTPASADGFALIYEMRWPRPGHRRA